MADARGTAAAPAVATLAIVGPGVPVYEADLAGNAKVDSSHLHQFVLHAASDAADDSLWHEAAAAPPLAFASSIGGGGGGGVGAVPLTLRLVDRFNALSVSAYVTAGRYKMLLLHDARISEDSAMAFMRDLHEPLVKVLLNPLREAAEYIADLRFDERVRALARRHFGG